MNHKLIRMMEEAGFPFTPDTMHRLPEFEKLIQLEREACAKVCDDISKDSRGDWKNGAMECEEAIRARGQHGD
jgi:hypothetical protein